MSDVETDGTGVLQFGMSQAVVSDLAVPEPAVLEPAVPEPMRPELDPDDPLTQLRRGVEAALLALPSRFSFPHSFGGVDAPDLFNLNTLLGAGIEGEVVRALNGTREVWDPDKVWSEYAFERSSQAFPDVRLVKRVGGEVDVRLGIELKGWFLFAKERVPSLRYQVSPAACAPHDMICVVPWYLSNAVSGVPYIAQPWVESARYAAEYRDYWWQHVRKARKLGEDKSVEYPAAAAPYPSKADLVTARPAYDGGDNFGRLPRCKPLMDAFIDQSLAFEVLGVSVDAWAKFLKDQGGS